MSLITLISESGQKHQVPLEFQHASEFIKGIIEDSGTGEEIPLVNITDD